MTEIRRLVVGGVDAHTDSHHAVALNERGRLLGDAAFATNVAGYQELFAWLERFGQVERVGVESTGHYAAGLARFLAARGIAVVEVNQPHAHARRRQGKSVPLDAEAAARKVLAGEATAIPKHSSGIVESIRQLRVAREGAVKANTAALNQLHELVITAPDELRQQLAARKTSRGKAALCLRLRPDRARLHEPLQAAKLALRSIAERVRELERQIELLDSHRAQLVAAAAPRTTSLFGVSTQHAGQLLVTAGLNIERLANDGAFARVRGASPIPASSGRTSRHRLNRGGDRNANRALHLIAVCRLRYCARTRAYTNRRTAEGLTKPEIIRCLKRYIARELYHTLRADLADLNPPTRHRRQRAVTIQCGAGPIGTTATRRRRRTRTRHL
jgi:transposase